MATLNEYMQDAQRLLREQKQDLVNPEDLRVFVNRARREIAMRTQCVRVITPISGPVVTGAVASPGSGYVAGSVSIVVTAPDFPSGLAPHPAGDQAIAVPIVQQGSLAAVNIQYGGDGYFQPQASVVSAVGAGANVSVQTQPINVLNQAQEVYPFSGVDLSRNPGAKSVYMIRSISIIYSNYRYSIPIYPFTTYQSMIRQYPFQYQYVPTFASQYGQGVGGSFYVYPLPSQTYQYELDCFCIPQDLTTDLSVEIVPDPWTDAVAFFTCFLGMASIQNYNIANFYKGLYDEFAQRFSNYARPGRGFNPYGRF
jgi:hypothetical protein